MIRQHPERVRSLEWHERGVTLAEVLDELIRLQARLGRHDVDEGEHPHPRNCVLNLVAIAESAEEADQVEDAAAELAADHPMRLLCLTLEPARNRSQLDAWVRAEAHELPGGMPIQFEMVRLRTIGAVASAPASLIEPLLVPDVPTYLWWHGSPPLGRPYLGSVLELVDTLIVDSASFERPFLSTIELSDLAAEEAGRTGLFDLQWGRLGPWREELAQFFTPADRRPLLRGFSGLGIDYVGEGRGNRVAAALLVGWLASALGWRLQGAAAGQGGLVQAYYADRGHPVEVSIRSVTAPDLGEGEIAAVRVEAAAGGRTASFAMERDLERRSRARVAIEVGELDRFSEWRPLESPREAEILVEMIPAGRRDRVYLSALQGCGDLLRALR